MIGRNTFLTDHAYLSMTLTTLEMGLAAVTDLEPLNIVTARRPLAPGGHSELFLDCFSV